MKKFDFNIFFIIPITHKIIPLHIKYEHKTLFEHIVMPWETGVSKNIKFSALLNSAVDKIDISKLKIINNLNKTPVMIESISINDQIQNVASHIPESQKHIYLDTFFKACDIDATIFKIVNLPDTVHLSHSYFCNGSQYVPKCDRHQSVMSFQKEVHPNFSFYIQCFDSNTTDCLGYIECQFNQGVIETKIHHKDNSDIQALHDKLKLHYTQLADEEFIDIIASPSNAKNSIDIATLLQDIDHYSVIKIEGLPENITHHEYEIFYQNHAYYISNQDKKLCQYLLSQSYEDRPITISYYKDDTLEPALQKMLKGPIFDNMEQKTA